VVLPLADPTLAVIVVLPRASAVTCPPAFTDATLPSDVLHDGAAAETSCPREVTRAVSV
jgi:hypothetical protein